MATRDHEVKYNFKNEIGNPIQLIVKRTQDTATQWKSGKQVQYDGVCIQMAGPTSEFENKMTLLEAKILFECLSIFFDRPLV